MTMPLSGERPMLTSFWPTATSCNTADSNFNTSFDMGTPSRSRLCFWIFLFGAFKPAPNFGEVPARFRRITQNNHGDVVAAAGLIGQVHEAAGGALRILGLLQHAGNLGGGQLAKQSIGADEGDVAIHEQLFGDV